MEQAKAPIDYIRANTFLDALRRHKRELTYQQYATLRGQALSGDVGGALKGLETILARR